MTYKGYTGVATYDYDAQIFHGDVANISDVVTFQGKTVGELAQAFRDSVDCYLQFCADEGKAPG